jgi:hypothetical protein
MKLLATVYENGELNRLVVDEVCLRFLGYIILYTCTGMKAHCISVGLAVMLSQRSISYFAGMGPRLPGRISSSWDFSREICRCSDHGLNRNCKSRVSSFYLCSRMLLICCLRTDSVQEDVISTLRMSPQHLFKVLHPCNRSNLYYEVHYMSSLLPHTQMLNVCEYISTLHGRKGKSSGIVYCRAKKTCDELSAFLSKRGISARPYHRGIP